MWCYLVGKLTNRVCLYIHRSHSCILFIGPHIYRVVYLCWGNNSWSVKPVLVKLIIYKCHNIISTSVIFIFTAWKCYCRVTESKYFKIYSMNIICLYTVAYKDKVTEDALYSGILCHCMGHNFTHVKACKFIYLSILTCQIWFKAWKSFTEYIKTLGPKSSPTECQRNSQLSTTDTLPDWMWNQSDSFSLKLIQKFPRWWISESNRQLVNIDTTHIRQWWVHYLWIRLQGAINRPVVIASAVFSDSLWKILFMLAFRSR